MLFYIQDFAVHKLAYFALFMTPVSNTTTKRMDCHGNIKHYLFYQTRLQHGFILIRQHLAVHEKPVALVTANKGSDTH